MFRESTAACGRTADQCPWWIAASVCLGGLCIRRTAFRHPSFRHERRSARPSALFLSGPDPDSEVMVEQATMAGCDPAILIVDVMNSAHFSYRNDSRVRNGTIRGTSLPSQDSWVGKCVSARTEASAALLGARWGGGRVVTVVTNGQAAGHFTPGGKVADKSAGFASVLIDRSAVHLVLSSPPGATTAASSGGRFGAIRATEHPHRIGRWTSRCSE